MALTLKKAGKYASCGRVLTVPTEDIRPNPAQPRRHFAYAELLELAQSIQENGLLNPIGITFREGVPQLVAGERRLRAAKLLGLATVPCVEVQASDRDCALLSLIENLQRQDMNCFETAEGIRRLMDVYGLTQEAAAQKLGCSQSAVANRLRLLRLSEAERARIVENGLTERHARALLKVDDAAKRQEILSQVIARRLTVAQTEALIAAKPKTAPPPRRLTPHTRSVQLFANTVERAAEMMNQSGVDAAVTKTETGEYIEYVVRIEKAGRAG